MLGEPGLGIDLVELPGHDQRGDAGSSGSQDMLSESWSLLHPRPANKQDPTAVTGYRCFGSYGTEFASIAPTPRV